MGIFDAQGGVSETEIWCDARVLQGAYRRGNTYQLVVAKLDSSDTFDTFRDWLTANPQLNVQVRRETEYYAQQSRALSGLIRGVGFGIAALMGIGAVFGAILTMYPAVSTRSREIATLRALGFDASSVVVSVMAESMALAAIGGVIGGIIAYLGFNGYQTSTINFQTFSQVAFAFRVTPQLLGLGLIYALLMGLVGGVFPAIRAARLPIPVPCESSEPLSPGPARREVTAPLSPTRHGLPLGSPCRGVLSAYDVSGAPRVLRTTVGRRPSFVGMTPRRHPARRRDDRKH